MAVSFSSSHLDRTTAILSAVPMTFACWWKPASVTAFSTLISIASQTAADYFILVGDNVGKIRAMIETAGVTATATSAAAMTVGTWYHVAAVYISATSRLVYLNGVSASNATSSTPVSLTTTSIGCNYSGSVTVMNPANGTIAFPGIWNIGLSSSDIAALYNSGLGADPRTVQNAALVSFSPLSETVSPWTDTVTSVAWTTTGSPSFATDPFSLNPVTPPPPAYAPPFGGAGSLDVLTTDGLETQYQINK